MAKSLEYQKFHESLRKINEDSLDDFDNGHRVNLSKKYFTLSGYHRLNKDAFYNLLTNSKHAFNVKVSDGSFQFTCKCDKTQIRDMVKLLLSQGERNVWYVHFICSDTPDKEPTMYSPEISNDMMYSGDIDKVSKYLGI